ncbi:ribosomal protein S18-alanine N-acetyltransferase [Pseudonocardia endophytica]|uniref:Ribosomal-protein-alanine N-acetyltransferase n=1 Tax=Pseudonocardia endophytica TaxID=401976 RepID=A0A4R1HIU4_PSEEN|nr:ribosomal protein S18-alanine N-acetyltransferase [Pseudonocardia endophytica]TCK20385.1 ribosomal-protein-alanine N-acetyltransferase [Pseudonocardia endophytica]
MSAPAAGGRVSIGPLYRADADRCAELERILFPGDDPWSAQAFRDAVGSGHLYLGLRGPDGRLIGYAGLGFVAGPPQAEAEVHTIGVDPEWQGAGLGRLLLNGLLEAADQVRATVFLEVRTDNETAQTLYASTGFVVVGVRKRYYRPSGADAYTMRRDPLGAEPAAD